MKLTNNCVPDLNIRYNLALPSTYYDNEISSRWRTIVNASVWQTATETKRRWSIFLPHGLTLLPPNPMECSNHFVNTFLFNYQRCTLISCSTITTPKFHFPECESLISIFRPTSVCGHATLQNPMTSWLNYFLRSMIFPEELPIFSEKLSGVCTLSEIQKSFTILHGLMGECTWRDCCSHVICSCKPCLFGRTGADVLALLFRSDYSKCVLM